MMMEDNNGMLAFEIQTNAGGTREATHSAVCMQVLHYAWLLFKYLDVSTRQKAVLLCNGSM